MATILESHEEVAVCYAMREELVQLYELRDEETARQGWLDWFAASKTNGIPALVRFAELKEKRLPGLAAHATTPISTEKLEGFNNVIKTAKRAAYGYLNKVFSKADKVAIATRIIAFQLKILMSHFSSSLHRHAKATTLTAA